MENLTSIIEAILFAAGDAVPIELLRDKLEITKKEVDESIRKLEKKYSGSCGIRLLHFNNKLQLATNPDYKEPVSSALMPIREKEFTRTILECSAIIAYKQPITRGELESIRGGMSCDYAISTLLNLEMMAPCVRRDTPGRPIEYATTDNFLKRFKLKSLAELPDYDELMAKIAALTAEVDPGSNYLYEKDVYDPDNDPDLMEEEEIDEEPKAEEKSFEVPDFLKDVNDDIFKIE